MKTLKTVIRKGTWLGLAGVNTTYHLDTRRDGLRVNVLALEGEQPEVSLIEGDGRKPNFKVHAAGIL